VTDLDQRYRRTSTARRATVIGVGVLLVASLLAWVVWATAFRTSPVVQSQLVSYDVRDAHAVTATFSVVRQDQSVRASCVLQAVASDHAVVGQLAVPVGTGQGASSTVRRTVRTERRATTVNLVGCTAPGQKQPG
jgi:hypothetical protein